MGSAPTTAQRAARRARTEEPRRAQAARGRRDAVRSLEHGTTWAAYDDEAAGAACTGGVAL
ncbi:hypothetical protein [Streptomyces sp. G45]|uniref:hypothetical protein n=1 Tax=Streptomyces sp. G45 TaxID=3406627 RepID=UPI003C2A8C12